MDLQEAQAFFLQYNGLEFHMFHDDPRRYRAFQALSIPQATLEEWRQQLIAEHFAHLEAPAGRGTFSLALLRLLEVLAQSTAPVQTHCRRLIRLLSAAEGLEEAQKLRVLELMAGREGDGHDGGVWLVCTRSGLAPELGRALEQLGGFPCSWAEMDRYQRALQKIRRILAGFVSPAAPGRAMRRPGPYGRMFRSMQ